MVKKIRYFLQLYELTFNDKSCYYYLKLKIFGLKIIKVVKRMEPTKEIRAVTSIFHAVQAIQDIIRQEAASYGLNATEFAVLELLFYKGDQPIQTVGKKILIANSSITYVVDKLEKKQLISRKDCPNDRRVIYASLTEEGIQLMKQMLPQHLEKIHTIFECLEEKEIDQITQSMGKIGDQAEKI